MPVTVQIDASAKIVFSTFAGNISEDDFRTAVAVLPYQPGFDPAFSHIIDFSQVTESNVSTEFVRSLARRPSLFWSDARQLIVASQNFIFGLARMVQILRSHQSLKVEVVRSRSEACKLLGIEFEE